MVSSGYGIAMPTRAGRRAFPAVQSFLTLRGRWLRMCKAAPLLICLWLLAACGAQPTPAMFGAARQDHRLEGRDYVLYRKGTAVEVIRLGAAARGEHQAIRAQMVKLIKEIPDCDLIETSLRGDSGEMRGRLRCNAADAGATVALQNGWYL